MIKKSKKLRSLFACILGLLWSYSFSARVNLLFSVPFWVKIVVMLGLGFNFILTAYYLIQEFLIYFHDWKKAAGPLVVSLILSGAAFALLPYGNALLNTTNAQIITANAPIISNLENILTVADFVTLTTLLLLILWIGIKAFEKKIGFKKNIEHIRLWAMGLVSIVASTFFIEYGSPDAVPFRFLILFIPTTLLMAYSQLRFYYQNNILPLRYFIAVEKFISKFADIFKNLNRSPWSFWIVIIIIAMVGGAIQIHLTRDGMGLSGDSVHYMEGAKNIAKGNGYVRHISEGDPIVMTGFPPVYPLALVPAFWLGEDVQQYARFLNTFLFALTLILTGWIVYKSTHMVIPAAAANIFLIVSPPILTIYSWVMSEPLFHVLLLATFVLWFWHINKPKVWKVILTGVTAGIMILTRLAGLAFLPPVALGILFFQKGCFKRRIRDAILFGVVSILAPAAFFIRNSLLAKRLSESRGLTLATFQREYWQIIGAEVASWFKLNTYLSHLSERYQAFWITLGLIVSLTLGWLLFRKKFAEKKADPIVILILLSIPVYLLLLILNTILLTPGQTQYGLSRYMIPVLLFLSILLGKILTAYWEKNLIFPKLAIVFLILAIAPFYYLDFAALLREQPPSFRQYNARKAECGDELTAIIDSIEDSGDPSYYTNNCEYFYYMTGIPCRHLPLEAEAYQNNGEVYQAIVSGDLIAYAVNFGTNPPGVKPFLEELIRFDTGCYLEFYRWPSQGD
jgi:hypothetical protein